MAGQEGRAVHTAARICNAAHGGQIVLSSAVQAAVADSLANGVSLRSLGAWRFQGLREPEDLFQVAAADLIADFPPPRSATEPSSSDSAGPTKDAQAEAAAVRAEGGRRVEEASVG